MTKRAGKKKNKQPTPRPPTIIEDNLSKAESLKLELRALSSGWLVKGEFDQYRQALMKKVALNALQSTTDLSGAVAALRAISSAELKQQQLQLQAIALELRANGIGLPSQVSVGVSVSTGEISQQPMYEILQELLDRDDVHNAIQGRVNDSDQSSGESDGGAV